tara:strand:- start:98 stop:505 length:408 start_codon:yes stop_codon:yes gene_type:complete
VSKDVKTDLLTIHTVKKEAWVMDNRSSYVANIATGLLKSTFFTVLLAQKNASNTGIAKLRPILRMFTALGIEMENVLWVRDEAGKYDVYGKRVEEDIVTLTHFPYWCGWIDVVDEELNEEVDGGGRVESGETKKV